MASKYSELQLRKAQRESLANKTQIASARDCGCYYCLAHFPASEIEEWADDGDHTAVCPKCGIDSVIAEHVHPRVDDELLVAMKKRFFG